MSVAVQSVVRTHLKHHWLVRVTHWCNIPLLLGLSLSGLSIYWASPVHTHQADPSNGNQDYLADIGVWLCAHLWFLRSDPDPANWVYEHLSLGSAILGPALRLHWLLAYLFVLNGALYFLGLVAGGGLQALLPERNALRQTFAMVQHYVTFPLRWLARRPTSLPANRRKYNALQRAAYASVALAGIISVLSGWAIHKPVQLWWIAALFGGYNAARIWHLWLMVFFLLFTVPHVAMVVADGWDTMRSMITGWSKKGGSDVD